jgi:hypothetical protein
MATNNGPTLSERTGIFRTYYATTFVRCGELGLDACVLRGFLRR